MLAQIRRLIARLLTLQRGPQDMPADQRVMAGLGVIYCVLSFLQAQIVASTSAALIQAVMSALLMVVYVRIIVTLRGYPARFVQTQAALFATSAVLTLLMLGPTSALAPTLEAMAKASGSTPANVPTPSPFVLLVYMIVGFWSLAVYGHIYRNALQTNIWVGVGAALGYEVLLVVFFGLLGV